MKKVTSGSVVCCPKCGALASISEIGIDRLRCKKCNLEFGSWVVGGFVTVFEIDSSDNQDYLERFENCRDKIKKLYSLKS